MLPDIDEEFMKKENEELRALVGRLISYFPKTALTPLGIFHDYLQVQTYTIEEGKRNPFARKDEMTLNSVRVMIFLLTINYYQELMKQDSFISFMRSQSSKQYIQEKFVQVVQIAYQKEFDSIDFREDEVVVKISFNILKTVFFHMVNMIEIKLIPCPTEFIKRGQINKCAEDTFVGACKYRRMMLWEQIKSFEFYMDPNDVIEAFRLLFNLKAVSSLRIKFANQLRGIFFNEKYKNTSLELLVLHLGSSINLN